MTTPLLHVLAGPNGSGKSTFASRVLQRRTGLPFVNADVIAAERWPGAESGHAYEAATLAAHRRDDLIVQRRSFLAETVFSHPSKVDLVARAVGSGYWVDLHVMLVPVELAVCRVAHRVDHGGHAVPADKIRERYQRLWPLVAAAIRIATRTQIYDNTDQASPFRLIATFDHGTLIGDAEWPIWTPSALIRWDDRGHGREPGT